MVASIVQWRSAYVERINLPTVEPTIPATVPRLPNRIRVSRERELSTNGQNQRDLGLRMTRYSAAN